MDKKKVMKVGLIALALGMALAARPFVASADDSASGTTDNGLVSVCQGNACGGDGFNQYIDPTQDINQLNQSYTIDVSGTQDQVPYDQAPSNYGDLN